MLKLVGHLPAAPGRVAELFEDVESWPRWMIDIRQVRVIDQQPECIIAEFQQRQLGRELLQRVELRRRERGLMQVQRSVAMHWQGGWRFLVPPDGRGTTLSLQVDLELLGLGRWLPDRLLRSTMDQWFQQLLAGAVGALAERSAARPPTPAKAPNALLEVIDGGAGLGVRFVGRRISLSGGGAESRRVVLELWQTPRGLEVDVDGRRHLMNSWGGFEGG